LNQNYHGYIYIDDEDSNNADYAIYDKVKEDPTPNMYIDPHFLGLGTNTTIYFTHIKNGQPAFAQSGFDGGD
jgi:hypothetical protein